MSEQWIAVVASPRKGKNTDLIVDYVLEALKVKGIHVKKYYLTDNKISTCKGCERCLESGTCFIQDEVTKIIAKMKAADGYILASPTYNYNMTAQMKAFLDRTFCLNNYVGGWKSRLPEGKKSIIIGVCAGKTKESMGYTIKGMEIVLTELGVEIIDSIEYFNTKQLEVIKNDTMKDEVMQRIIKNSRL